MNNKKEFRSNLLYIIHIVYQYNPWIFITFIGVVVFSSIVPLLEILIPKLLLQGIINGSQLKEMVVLLVLLACSLWLLNIWVSYLQKEYNRMISLARTDCFGDLIMNKTYRIRYYLLEYPEVQQLFEKARMVSFSDKEGVEGTLRHLHILLSKGLTLIGLGIVIARLSPIIVILLVLGVSMNIWMLNKIKDKEIAMRDSNATYDRYLTYYTEKMSDFSYAKDIRLYNLSNWISGKYKTAVKGKIANHKKVSNAYMGAVFFQGICTLIQQSLTYGCLIYSVINQGMGIDDFSLYFGAIASFSGVLVGMIDSGTSIFQFSKCITDMQKLMGLKDEKGDPISQNQHIKGEIEFQNMEFAYPGCNEAIYKDFNLKIRAGEKVAIIGKNGAGKSTLIKLLVGLHECNGGKILIDGKDTKELDSQTLYSLFSVVLQQINQYAFSLAENVVFQDYEKIDKERLKSVLKQSGLIQVVENLDKDIKTCLRKDFDPTGVDLSGGQAQKLALARALYKDAPVLILDEPTAAMDALAEAQLYEQFNDLIGDKTALYISHRLSSTHFCDRIALIDEGRVIEYGTYDELMDLKGEYWKMFRAQSYYYQEEIPIGEI